jgi:hypothetical protein
MPQDQFTSNGAVIDLTDVDAERRYLGAALLTPNLSALHGLEPQTFYREDHRSLYRAIASVETGGDYPEEDAFSFVMEELRRGTDEAEGHRLFAYATELVAIAEPLETTHATANLLEVLALRRKVLHLGHQIDQASYTIADPERLRSRIRALTDFALGSSQPTATEIPTKPGALRLYTDTELAEMDLPPIAEVIPGLFGAGHYLLSGAPKMGKSFLVMSLAYGLAMGGVCLGEIHVDQHDVLYLCLEDGLRRTVTRLRQRAEQIGTSGRLQLAFEWPSLDDGGLEYIRAWLRDHPAGVVFIDTGKRLRQGQEDNSRSFYASDYDFISPITDLAHEHDTLIVTVWHDRKMLADDFFDQVNASRGLTAAVDGVAQLHRERGSKEAKLSIGDRDTEDRAFSLQWDEILQGWRYVGPVDVVEKKADVPTQVYLSVKRLESDDMGVTSDMVAVDTGLPKGSVKNAFTTLRGQGVIRDVARGRVKTTADQTDQ